MADAGPPHPQQARPLARRAALALMQAVALAGVPIAGSRPVAAQAPGGPSSTGTVLAPAVLAEAPSLLVAGPAGGRLDRWATALTAALAPVLPAGTRLRHSAVGGDDGVTGANQFTTRVTPDGNTLLLAPGDAALAWLVGDPRAQFDAAKWLGVMAGLTPAVVCGRAVVGKPGEKLRVGMAGPVGPDLVALLGLEVAGLSAMPVFGVLDQGAAAQALASRAVDVVLLRGAGVAANLGALAQVGVEPLFTLGAAAGEGRDPLLPSVPNLVEFAMRRSVVPSAGLFAAWRAVATAAQVEYALVLPLLTPAALVALWRQVGSQAAASAELHDTTGRTRSLGVPEAHAVTHALAPDAAAIAELRAWLLARLGWRPPA